MSLINEALKKAQREREQGSPPAPPIIPPPSPPAAPTPPPPRSSRSTVVAIIVGAVLCITLSVLITGFLLKPSAQNPAPVVAQVSARPTPMPPAPSVAPTPVPAFTSPQPIATPLPTAAPTPAFVETPALTVAAAPTPMPTPVPTLQPPTPVATPAPTAASTLFTKPSEEAAPALEAKLGPRIEAFISRLKITSIRISPSGNKAILNDRVYRANDLLEPALGLRLTTIEPSTLTFTDENGRTYVRHF